jgi:hypothetical protein
MKTDVERALAELREGLVGHDVRHIEDGTGGAFVVVSDLFIGDNFSPSVSWVGFHITWPYPDADVYPHFIDSGVTYVGQAAPNVYPEGALPTSLTRGAMMPGFSLPAIQVSRRSNRRQIATDTALHKLLRVVEFLRSR